MTFADLSTGARLFYEEANSAAGGIPVVAIHGMLGTGRKDLGHVIDWLADEGYHVIAPTLRGYGESMPKPRDFPPNFYERDANDVLAFMDALQIDRAHLIGYSDGGEITLICAGKQPARFVSAAAWGAVGYLGPEMRMVAQRMIPGSSWLKLDELAMHSLDNPDAFAEQWVRGFTQMVDAGGRYAVDLAPHVQCPVLIMLGDKDTLNPPTYAQTYLQGVQQGRLAMFDAGHPIHNQQTAIFRQTLLAHLKAATP